jgi:hypothetical protein
LFYTYLGVNKKKGPLNCKDVKVFGYTADAWSRSRDYRSKKAGVLAHFDDKQHRLILLHKCTAENVPFGLGLDAYGFALSIEFSLEDKMNKFDCFPGVHAGNGSSTNQNYKTIGTSKKFLKFVDGLLDKALADNKAVTANVS